MKKNIVFIDANNNRVVIDIEISTDGVGSGEKRSWEDLSVIPVEKEKRLSILGNIGGSCGQVYDYIAPRTEGQQKLIELWREYHLNDMCPGTKLQTEYLRSDKYKEDFDYLSNFFSSCNYNDVIDKTVKRKIEGREECNRYYFYKSNLLKEDLDKEKRELYESNFHSMMKNIWLKEGKYTIRGIIRGKLEEKGISLNLTGLSPEEKKVYDTYMKLFDLYTGRLKNTNMSDFTYKQLLLEWNGLHPDRGYRYGSAWLFKALPDDIEEKIEKLCTEIDQEESLRSKELIAKINERKIEEDDDADENDDDEVEDFKMSLSDDSDTDEEHVNTVMDVLHIDEDEAIRFVALGKALGEHFSNMDYSWEEQDGDKQLYKYGGKEYYIGTEDELTEVAKDIVENDPEMKYFWKQAVESDSTEEGFEEWRDSIVDKDGFENTLDRYDGCGTSVRVIGKRLTVCNAG